MAVEFVALALPYFLIVFLVLEVTLAFFWWKSAEKATFMGARLAIVQDVAASGLLADLPDLRIPRSTNGVFGKHCADASNPCTLSSGDSWVCETNGTGCVAQAKANIVTKMQSILAVIEPENVEIVYQHVGLGYAGGPLIPSVTVRLTGLQFQTGFVSIIGGLLGGPSLTTMPDITATLTGEDLSAAAVGS